MKDLLLNTNSEVDPFTDFLSAPQQQNILASRNNFSEITVVDLETGSRDTCQISQIRVGRVIPGRRMQYVAACTLSGIYGIAPEADPALLRNLIDSLEAMPNINSSTNLKPALPARYRVPIYLRLKASLNPSESCALYPPPCYQSIGELL